MIKELENFLNKAVIYDLSDKDAEEFIQIINSHVFIVKNISIVRNIPVYIWNKYICQNCGYDLDSICWTNIDIWDTKICQECQIKRLLE